MVNDDRGQLILIGALLVAATILGSITLLNTIHESPEVKTQQDARSLQDTELKMSEVHSNLERLFLYNVSVNETGEPLPYTNSSFAGVVEEYERQSMNLSSTTTAGILNVTYLGGVEGGIARQNRTDSGYEPLPGSPAEIVLEDATTIPRLSVIVNETGASSASFQIKITGDGGSGDQVELELDSSGGTDSIEKTVSGATEDPWTCSGFDFDRLRDEDKTLQIDFIKGQGEISTDEVYCGNLTLGTSLEAPLEVEFENPDDADGSLVITGTGSSVASPAFSGAGSTSYQWFKEPGSNPGPGDYIVNPKFRVEYQSPNVAYNSTFALYNTTGR